MIRKTSLFTLLAGTLLFLLFPFHMDATRLEGVRQVDKDYLMVHFQDGVVTYRDNATGPGAYRGHFDAPGDDTLKFFGTPLDVAQAALRGNWKIYSKDDKAYRKGVSPKAVFRKSKSLNMAQSHKYALDHWLFLSLPTPLKNGCTYTVKVSPEMGADKKEASFKYDIFSSQSEALHVNIIGYMPTPEVKAADLYLWLGEGGERDYSSFVGKKVWLYDVNTKKKTEVSTVSFLLPREASQFEERKRDLTGSSVWKIDFPCKKNGKYRLVVEDVGCSMDFEIGEGVYYEPYRTSLRGYYYMRLGEPITDIRPVPRQPQFIPDENPKGFKVYLTDLQPSHPEWRKFRGDIWDEPHFKDTEASMFYAHRLPGNPTNPLVRGGHSDAYDWDRHMAHVVNIYDILLPYILSGGALSEDNLGIRESGNGIPDLIDEARNEVDFFLSCRDGEAYSPGVTNPSRTHDAMFQAGPTTLAAWANAANCAILAESFRLSGHPEETAFYRDEAIKAYRFAQRQPSLQLDDVQGTGDGGMRGRDFKHQAAAFLYNVTGDTYWEDEMASESTVRDSPEGKIFSQRGPCQIWGAAAYLTTPQPRHYPDLYSNLCRSLVAQAQVHNVQWMDKRPSRRSSNTNRWQTTENLQLVMLAHYLGGDPQFVSKLLSSMILEADWGLGRNPTNMVEMTGLGQRHIVNCYTTGRNDGTPEVHPGHTPFNSTEVWSKGNGGDATILTSTCYPDWEKGRWPYQEAYFNTRYFWSHSEFTPRETMRGKMALLAYLYYLGTKK